MSLVSKEEIARKRQAAAERKAKRTEKGKALGLRRSKRRKPSARTIAFLRLKNLCKEFVLLRANKRTGGYCEVGLLCGGAEPATLAYHVFPAANGNAIKYDVGNLLGACARDNGAEYFDRKRGTYARWDIVHRLILGDEAWSALKTAAGRMKISTAEAVAMADALQARITAGDFQDQPKEIVNEI